MSHVRPESKTRHRLSSCKRGRHNYGPSQHIGAGIARQVCDTCGSVTIDLTEAEALTTPIVQERRPFLAAR